MVTPDDNKKRMDRVRKLLGFKSDVVLAEGLGTNQPQISRWRHAGFHPSTANLLDALLSIISKQQREINKLKKEIKSPKQGNI